MLSADPHSNPLYLERQARDTAIEQLRTLLEGKTDILRHLEKLPVANASAQNLRIESEFGHPMPTGHSIDMIKVGVGNLFIILRWCQGKLISCILQTEDLKHTMGLISPHYNGSVREEVTPESKTGIGGIDEINVPYDDISSKQISSITEIIKELLQKLEKQAEGQSIEAISEDSISGFRKMIAEVLNAHGKSRGNPEIIL